MKLKNKEEKQKQREKEKEEKERLKEKEKEEKLKREEKNRKEREEKERQKQLEKEEKLKEKEQNQKQRQKEREEKEKQKQLEKEEKEREKIRLREERKKYNERFQITSARMKRGDQSPFHDEKKKPQGTYYQRMAYKSNRLYKRRHSHKRIQPKNRIKRLEAKKQLGKTTLKIIKPKRYDNDEDEYIEDPADFTGKLMKFPIFKAKYGRNYALKKKTTISINSETKYGRTNTNFTISEEEEKNTNGKKHGRRGQLGEIKPKRNIMDKKMKEILGKHYKLLLDDPNNPYGTAWPSNFLKRAFDTGFEYNDFQSGVPVLKLKNLGKKQLPPIKKKGQETIYSPNKNTTSQKFYPGTSAKKGTNVKFDVKVNKSDNLRFNSEKENIEEEREEKEVKLNGILEENEN